MGRRVAVAVKTPSHAERLGLVDPFHAIDPSMAGNAAYAPADVGAVVEIDVIGKIVDPDPRDGFARLVTLANGSQLLDLGADVPVAVQADRGGGDRREGGRLDRRVAITAIEPHLASMDFMGERKRLHGSIADVGRPGRPAIIKKEDRIDRPSQHQNAHQQPKAIRPCRKQRLACCHVMPPDSEVFGRSDAPHGRRLSRKGDGPLTKDQLATSKISHSGYPLPKPNKYPPPYFFGGRGSRRSKPSMHFQNFHIPEDDRRPGVFALEADAAFGR